MLTFLDDAHILYFTHAFVFSVNAGLAKGGTGTRATAAVQYVVILKCVWWFLAGLFPHTATITEPCKADQREAAGFRKAKKGFLVLHTAKTCFSIFCRTATVATSDTYEIMVKAKGQCNSGSRMEMSTGQGIFKVG